MSSSNDDHNDSTICDLQLSGPRPRLYRKPKRHNRPHGPPTPNSPSRVPKPTFLHHAKEGQADAGESVCLPSDQIHVLAAAQCHPSGTSSLPGRRRRRPTRAPSNTQNPLRHFRTVLTWKLIHLDYEQY